MVSILEPSQKKQRPIPSGPIAKNYLAREGKKLRTVEQREHHLNQLIFPILGDRPTSEVRRSELFPLWDRRQPRHCPGRPCPRYLQG